jgi:hypothetical protein
MINPTWHFEKMARAGSITGSAVMESLIGANLGVEEILAREALQNSCDATLEKQKTRIKITQIANDNQILENIEFHSKLANHIQHTFYQHDDRNESEYTNHVIIEDFNTCGLGGDIEHINESSHFSRLVYHNATGIKVGNLQNVGGSFGRGKAAYPSASHICTVFYYTVFLDETGTSKSRLIGVSYAREYVNTNEERMTGRAFWGIRDTEDNDFFVSPIVGQQAHEYAKKIGFTQRAEGETGTSILILKCHVDLNQLCSAIETWWWPRLSDQLLDIDIHDSSGKQYTVQPKQNITLQRFIDTYEEIGNQHRSEMINYSQVKEANIAYGEFVYKIIDASQAQLDVESEQLQNSIALIRGPRMVVEYLYPRGMSNVNYGCGVFVASKNTEIDDFFKRSEPPAHDKWADKSERLSESEKKILKKILDGIRKQFREFVNQHEQSESDTGQRGRELERLLGEIFGGTSGLIKPPKPAKSDLFSITQKKQYIRDVDDMFVRHVVEFNVSLQTKNVSTQLNTAKLVVNTHISARGAGSSADLRVGFHEVWINGQSMNPLDSTFQITVGQKPTKCLFVTHPVVNTFQTEWHVSLTSEQITPEKQDE